MANSNMDLGKRVSALETGGGGGGISSTHNYSTEEHIVGKWIDNKPVYEKTMLYENIAFNNSDVLLENSVIENLDTLIDMQCTSLDVDNAWVMKSYANGSYTNAIYYIPNQGFHVTMKYGASGAYDKKIYITVQYTKTTD